MKQSLFLIPVLFFIFSCAVAQQKNNFYRFPTEKNVIYDICFTNSGDAIGIADNTSIKVYSTGSHELLGNFANGHKNQILSIDISADSTYLVSGGKDSTVVIWDFKLGKFLKSLSCNGIINSVCLSPDNQFIAFGGTDKKVSVYDITKGEMSLVFSQHSDDITSVSFSPDGRYIASSSGDRKIHLYVEGALVTTLSGHKNWVRDISFNSDGTRLLSCDDSGIVILWNISNLKNPAMINELRVGLNWLLSVDFHQDGKTYAVGDVQGNAKIIGSFATYRTNVKVPINRILLKPNETYFKIAVATRGKGVWLIEAKQMKSTH